MYSNHCSYGVSSRVQRIGQEETVNMVEPFKERIQEFFNVSFGIIQTSEASGTLLFTHLIFRILERCPLTLSSIVMEHRILK